MYKRAKKEFLTDENLNCLCQILSDDTLFYNLYYTKDVVKEMKQEAEEVKKTNGILYPLIDDFCETKKPIYSPFYLDNIDAFCKLNGFATLIELLQEKSDAQDFDFSRKVLDICIAVKQYMKEEYKFQFFTGIVDQIIQNFKGLSNESLKSMSQEDIEKFINCFEYVLESIYPEKVLADEIVERFELDLALRFLHMPYIEKRVCGLNILISKVNLVNRSNFG